MLLKFWVILLETPYQMLDHAFGVDHLLVGHLHKATLEASHVNRDRLECVK